MRLYDHTVIPVTLAVAFVLALSSLGSEEERLDAFALSQAMEKPWPAPATTLSTPVAFGAEWGDIFMGMHFVHRTRYSLIPSGAAFVGFGIGDSRKFAALEIAVLLQDLDRLFNSGAVSFKLHRTLSDGFALAIGAENAITWGLRGRWYSFFAVASKYFSLRENPNKPFSELVLHVGIGDGRFLREKDALSEKESVNVFGAISLRLLPPLSFIANWSGQDLGLGVSITPFRDFPAIINLSLLDVTRTAGDGSRFRIALGYGSPIFGTP